MALRVLLIDLFEGPGHRYYSGQLARALAQHPELTVGALIHREQDPAAFPDPIARFAIDAPTGLRGQAGRALRQPIELARLGRAVRRFRPDIIHSIFFHPWFALLAPLLRRPFGVTLHDVTTHPGEEGLVTSLARWGALRHGDFFFVHGETLLAEARALLPARRADLFSVAHGHFNALCPAPRPAPEAPVFLFFGRLLPYKGLGLALEAFSGLAASGARLIVAGAGRISEAEAEAIEALGSSVELIHRRVSDDELEALMGRSLAVLVPYLHASGSGVVATAAAFARGVIASRLGGLIDMVAADETGVLFEAGSAEGLRQAMAGAIADPKRFRALGLRARARAEEAWGWEAIAEAHRAVYRRYSEGSERAER